MKNWKYIWLAVILFPLMGIVSCSKDSEEEEEYANWQEKNEAQIDAWAANSAYTKYKAYTKDQTSKGSNSDYV